MSNSITLSRELTGEIQDGVMGALYTLSLVLHERTKGYVLGPEPPSDDETMNDWRLVLDDLRDLRELAHEFQLPETTCRGMEFAFDRTRGTLQALSLAAHNQVDNCRSDLGELGEMDKLEEFRNLLDRIDKLTVFAEQVDEDLAEMRVLEAVGAA